MLRMFTTVGLVLAGLLMTHCKPARSALTVGEVTNYNPGARDHILFLNFRISGSVGGREKVELVSAQAGDGRMKTIARDVHFPYQIKALARYSTGTIEQEMVFEHPLYRSAEVSDPTGHIRQVEATATEGDLMVRLQQQPGLNQLELFSVSPEKGTVKIYTLDFN